MTDTAVDLKRRSPVAWTVITLLVPFGILYWLHKSNRQIEHLSQQVGRPQRLLNPWWLTGVAILNLFLAVAFLVVLFASSNNTNNLPSASPSSSTTGLTSTVAPADPSATTLLADYSDDSEWDSDDFDNLSPYFLLPLLGLFVTSVAFVALYIIYLIKHVDGVVALAGTNEDKTLLLVMAILSAFLVQVLIAVVVYKSQEIINQAIDDQSGVPAAA